MGRTLRWLVAVGATVVVFGVCLWAFRYAKFPWLPQEPADRWVVTAGLATVTATAVLTALGWWAGREQESEPAAGEEAETRVPVETGVRVKQKARASGHGRIVQVGRDYHDHGPRDEKP